MARPEGSPHLAAVSSKPRGRDHAVAPAGEADNANTKSIQVLDKK